MSFLAGLYDPVEEYLYEASPRRHVSKGEPPSALSAVYDYEALAETVDSFGSFMDGSSLTRFLPLLPLNEGFGIDSSNLQTSPLELYEHPRLGTFGLKDETCHPTGSLWDRGAVVALSRAREWSSTTLLSYGRGPSVPSMIHFQGKTDMDAYCFLGKKQEQVHEAFVPENSIRWTESGLQNTTQKVMKLCEQYDLIPALPGWNPYYGEGIKTVAYELAEQLEEASGRIYVHTASDFLAPYIRKGFRELRTLGWFETTPEVIRVRLSPADKNGPEGIQFAIPDVRTVELSRDYFRKCRNNWSNNPTGLDRWSRADQIALAGAQWDDPDREDDGPTIVLSVGEPDDFAESSSATSPAYNLEGPPESLPDELFVIGGDAG